MWPRSHNKKEIKQRFKPRSAYSSTHSLAAYLAHELAVILCKWRTPVNEGGKAFPGASISPQGSRGHGISPPPWERTGVSWNNEIAPVLFAQAFTKSRHFPLLEERGFSSFLGQPDEEEDAPKLEAKTSIISLE